jgi:hypothetical protein
MTNFFTVIVIIAVSVFIFISYYASKNLYSRYRQKQLASEVKKKKYEDEKKHIRIYIRSLLKDLETGKLYWILIFSGMNPQVKLELIYNSITNLIQIQHHIHSLSPAEINKLKKMGLHSFDFKYETYCFNVSQNSTIVTDVIYFLLEHAGKQKQAQNIKVVTSGG